MIKCFTIAHTAYSCSTVVFSAQILASACRRRTVLVMIPSSDRSSSGRRIGANGITEKITETHSQCRLDLVGDLLAAILERDGNGEVDATFLRTQSANLLVLIKSWTHQPVDAGCMENSAGEEQFLGDQAGDILNLTKEIYKQTTAQGKQLAAQGDMLKGMLQRSADSMHRIPDWKTVFKCDCQIAKPPHPHPPGMKRTMRTLRQR